MFPLPSANLWFRPSSVFSPSSQSAVMRAAIHPDQLHRGFANQAIPGAETFWINQVLRVRNTRLFRMLSVLLIPQAQ